MVKLYWHCLKDTRDDTFDGPKELIKVRATAHALLITLLTAHRYRSALPLIAH